MPSSVPSGDRKLVQIIDSALAEAARKSGEWLVCRPGCTQCCMGPFAINQLDAERLRHGLGELETRDPQRATKVKTPNAGSMNLLTSPKMSLARFSILRLGCATFIPHVR